MGIVQEIFEFTVIFFFVRGNALFLAWELRDGVWIPG